MKRAVFLDRDGVLNQSIVVDGMPKSPRSVEQTSLYGDVNGACEALRTAGFLLICVTNQPNIARGTQSRDSIDAINAINAMLSSQLTLDDVRVCPHDDGDDCHCRKPKPGLILDAARDHGVDLQSSFMVGDRWRDTDAGRGLGEAAHWILGQ